MRARLLELFEHVESHPRLRGRSGIKWTVDFLVDSNLVVEASVQRRLETKINSTFIRFADITQDHPELRAALVVEELHVLLHHKRGRKYFPTSEYRTMLSFGFPLLAIGDIQRLTSFREGRTSALEASSKPVGFNPRSVSSEKNALGLEIMELLKAGPLPPREIARLTGRPRSKVVDVMRQLPRVKRISTYYGLEEEAILRKLLSNGLNTGAQRVLVHQWLRREFLERLRSSGPCRTRDFAADLATSPGSLFPLVHILSKEGIIVKAGKGTWALRDDLQEPGIV